MNIQIKADPLDIVRVKRALEGIQGAASKVMSRAVNKTLAGVKTDASTGIRAVINAKKKDVDATFKIKKATAADPNAIFSSTGRPIPLASFGARQTKKGVSVQVRKDRARKIIKGVFIATMKTGHTGVFWRTWHGKGATKKKGAKDKPGKLPASYRLPIKQRFSSRIPDILENAPVMGEVLVKAEARLHTNLNHELDFELSKLREA